MSVQGLGKALAEEVAAQLVSQAARLAPELIGIVHRGLAGASSTTTLGQQIRALLPEEGASARAERELRGK